jgi:hypothetical protein
MAHLFTGWINLGIPCALKKRGALLYEARVVIKELS